MFRFAVLGVLAAAIVFPSVVRSQERTERSKDDVRALQEQVEKLRLAIEETEARLSRSQADSEKEQLPAPGEAKSGADSPGEKRKYGRGSQGQMPPFGAFPRFPGASRGPNSADRPKSEDGQEDVKSLEAELERLKMAAQGIDSLMREVETRLKAARDRQDEARRKEEARRDEARRNEPSAGRGDGHRDPEARSAARAVGKMPRNGRIAGAESTSGDVEKRLERIERALEELQKQMRSQRKAD